MTDVGIDLQVSSDEALLRRQLAGLYRITDMLKWSLLIYNHITCRVPGSEHHFLINPYGLLYREINASNLVKVDIDGRIVEKSDWPVNPAGFAIHSAIHANIPEAACVMHTHTREGVAVACKKEGLSLNNFYSAMLSDQLAYHDFEGIVTMAEQERLVASMGNKPMVILRNHGLLVWGRTIPETFERMMTLQLACEIQVLSDAMSGPDIPISPEARSRSGRLSGLFDDVPGSSANVGDVFSALLREVERVNPGYAE